MIALFIPEAMLLRRLLLEIEKSNGHSGWDRRLHEALGIIEHALGYPPKRELLEAIRWDREHPGEAINVAELERRWVEFLKSSDSQVESRDCLKDGHDTEVGDDAI